MDSPTGDEQVLPGLEEPAPTEGLVARAARRTLAALDAEDLLTERDAVLCQSLISLAIAYDRAATSSRAKEYAIANLHAQLLSTIEQLPKPAEETADDPWTELERDLAKQARQR